MLMHQKQQQEEGRTEKGAVQSQHPVTVCVYVSSVCTCVSPALTFVDVECDGADRDANHAFRVVEKLNGLGVQGKVISVLCVGDREGALVSKTRHWRQDANDHRERTAGLLLNNEF